MHACEEPAVAPPANRQQCRLPRVAFAIKLDPGQKFGSMEEQIVLFAERFHAEGSLFAPVFMCGAGADASQFRSRGIDAVCLDLTRFSWRPLLALRRFIRSRKIDVLHWNFTEPLSNAYLWWLSLLTPRVHHWFTDHSSRTFPLQPRPRGVKRFVKRMLLRRYRRVIGVSRYVQECLADHAVWSNLVVGLHFVNTDRFRPDEAERRRLRTRMNVDGRVVLLAVGQLISDKGFHVLVRALADLPPQVVLWIVGKGPEEKALRKLCAELHLEDRVQLLGQQWHVQPYLQAADCFVCPSLWGEAAGLVNIEAQACGTAVIASRIGGIPEYVADGHTGLLFTSGDADDLARCIRQLLDEPTLCAKLGRAARAHVVEQFSQNARLDEWIELYRQWRD